MSKIISDGLTFDDILLIPKLSDIRSRRDVNISTQLTPNIKLHLPLISANMSTITETDMAIEMARLGGLGIIHRFCTIDRQVAMISAVKRADNFIIEKPYCISPDATIEEVRMLMHKTGVGSLLVAENNILAGIITRRDIGWSGGGDKVSRAMTPLEKIVVSYVAQITQGEAISKFDTFNMKHLVLVNQKYEIRGLICEKDIMKILKNSQRSLDKMGRLLVGGAIGVKDDFMDRAEALINAGCDIIVIDVAHGHSIQCLETIKAIRAKWPDFPIIAGNVCTGEGVRDLANAGANVIKVGVGPSRVCTTRTMTGAGMPQISAILNCAEMAKKCGVSIIADGGIQYAGDITKALGCGAHAVMMGSALAGTTESPSKKIIRNGKAMKMIAGMAGVLTNSAKAVEMKTELDLFSFGEEGVEGFVPYAGDLAEVLQKFRNGLQSGMSYTGARNLAQLHEKAEFVRVSSASIRENGQYNIDIL